MYTAEQLERREQSRLTIFMMVGGMVQFLIFLVSLFFVLRFITTDKGYSAAHITVILNIILLWANTVVGMLWEKDMYGKYFMHREFFWEDVGNLIALITHNAYFVVLWLQWSQRDSMLLILVAYITYLFNFGQWIVRYVRYSKRRKELTTE